MDRYGRGADVDSEAMGTLAQTGPDGTAQAAIADRRRHRHRPFIECPGQASQDTRCNLDPV